MPLPKVLSDTQLPKLEQLAHKSADRGLMSAPQVVGLLLGSRAPKKSDLQRVATVAPNVTERLGSGTASQ